MATLRRPMRGSASSADVEPDMNVTPLVDICLVLLIIFMVVAPRMNQDIQVDLPGIFNPDPDIKGSMDPLKITVPKAGEYYLNKGQQDDPITLDELEAFLKQLHDTDPFRKLVMRGDEKLKYGDARNVMARVQESGYPGISFLVGKRHRAGETDAPEVAATTEATGKAPAEGGAAPGAAPAAEAGTGAAAPGAAPADAGAAPAGAGAAPGNPGQGS
jgi:biopolymer transport protein TolR